VPIAWKFFLLLALVVPSLLAVSWVGGTGMVEMKARLDDVYEDNLTSTRAIGSLSVALQQAEELSLGLIGDVDPASIARLRSELREDLFPEIARRLDDVRLVSGPSSSRDGLVARSLETAWREFAAFADSRGFLAATGGPSDEDATASSTVQRLSTSLRILNDQLAAQELQQAQASKEEAERTYAHSLSVLRMIVAIALIAGIGVTIWLIRSVVVRVKEYSGFATRVAAGELNTRTRPRGNDELTDLGWSLNEMVARGEGVRGYEVTQGEFTDAMQVSETEEESYGLLKRHIERSIPQSTVVVLNRNNSADRLEATTELSPESGLAERLAIAQPRDCLAVRLARPHDEVPGGGEEFVMLLPDTDRDTAVQVAERVRTAIGDLRVLEGDSSVSASFGIAVFPEDAPDAARLVRNADRALYRAKANGRNRVEVFTLDAAPEGEPPTQATSVSKDGTARAAT